MFIYPTIKHYKDLWRVEDRTRSGRLKTVRAEAAIKMVRERICRHPLWKHEIMSWKLNISTQSSCASSGTIYTWQRTSAQRDTSLLLLWRWSDRQEPSVSSSGTPRTGTETSSSQTRKFLPSRSSITTRTTWFMLKLPWGVYWGCRRPSPFLCHGLVGGSHQEVTHLHFCEQGVKTGAWVYQEDVLQGAVKPLNMTVFNGQKWLFQQDLAPAHKAKTTQEWLWQNVPAFISAKDWPSGSPDLKPLDYKLWAVLEDMACRKHHNNLNSLKRSLKKVAPEIPLETVHATIAEWPECLKACIKAEGGHFEWNCCK